MSNNNPDHAWDSTKTSNPFVQDIWEWSLTGNLTYFERMEDSLLASMDISVNKAYTANALKMSTDKVTDLAKEDGALFGIQFTNEGRIVTFGGGYPLIVEGKVVGGIGVSGGTADQDMAIAQSALAIL